jgi:DNA ligase (NAD+)
VGEETALYLANYFHNLDNLIKASIEEINEIENIGPAVSKSVFDFFQDKNNLFFIQKLKKNGVIIEEMQELKRGKFFNLTFVLTGTLLSMSRNLAKEKIIKLGGKISNSVSNKTSYLLVGENPGSKLAEAQKNKIKIITENDFLKMI